MNYFNMVVQVVLTVFIGLFFLLFILFKVVEPSYMMFFNKPLFIHWYPFSERLKPHQLKILSDDFPFYSTLSPKRKEYFEHRILMFTKQYQFIGKDIVVTEQMRLLIAATYVMLTFGMRNYLVPLFKRIVIYPTAYFSTENEVFHKGEFNPMMKAVVFSWEDFMLGHLSSTDNLNLGLHEFTHVLHFHCMKNNDPSSIIFFDAFNEVVKYFSDSVLNSSLSDTQYFRSYAYENQFEFLAVVLEHFFETPAQFKTVHPDLYDHVVTMINYKENQ